jgi:hypothetical protein
MGHTGVRLPRCDDCGTLLDGGVPGLCPDCVWMAAEGPPIPSDYDGDLPF